MFERYSKRARNTIFFAREEALQLGTACIETQHLLLGVLRADDRLAAILREPDSDTQIRRTVEANSPPRKTGPANGDVPLSKESKRILAYAAKEAEKLGHGWIGSEHLVLGAFREKKCDAAVLLDKHTKGEKEIRIWLAEAVQANGRISDERFESPFGSVEARLSGQEASINSHEDESSLVAARIGLTKIDLTKFESPTPLGIKLLRVLWHCFQLPFFTHTPRLLSPLRIFLLRLFGAKIGAGCQIDNGVKVWIPWNLRMGEHSTLGFNTEIYNFAPVEIGDHVIVSQRSYVCTSTHDYTHPHFPLVSRPITIGSQAWLAAQVFIAPGIEIGEGAVIGACSTVTKSMPAWMICAGNPCRPIKPRVVQQIGQQVGKPAE